MRNSSSNTGNGFERELQKKKDMLMGEIREIELELKNKHLEEHI
jgi:hypothetical protein